MLRFAADENFNNDMRSVYRYCRPFVCCLGMCVAVEAPAAPPDVKSLFPAGGQRGQTVEVTVGGKLGTRPVGVWASRPGVTAEVPDKGDAVRVSLAEDAPPGVCWLRFHNAEGASGLRPFVVGTLPEIVEDEPNNDYAEPQELPGSSAVVNGRLERNGDVDAFGVSLSAGQTLVAAVDANRTFGSPMDGVLQVVSPRGFVLAQNDDGPELDPLLEFTAAEDGTYVVRLFAFPAEPTSSIRLAGGGDFLYRLTVTTGPVVDHVLPLAVTRDAEARLELAGWNIADDERWLPLAAGDETDVAAPFPVSRVATTEIRRLPHATAVEQEPNTADEPHKLVLPVAVTGCIGAPGDDDVYSFAAKKGEKRLFRIEARALGSPLDPVLELLDAAGKPLRRVDDARRGSFDCELEFTFAADGEYRMRVSDLYGHGGFRYVYLLTAAAPQPDYALSVKGDVFQLKPGQPLEIPVRIERTNGFGHDVEITLAGAPDGIRAEPVKSPQGDTETSLKLKLQADEGTVFQGPIRIVGRVADQPDLERTAAAPIAGLSSTTTDVWLTVAGAPEAKQP